MMIIWADVCMYMYMVELHEAEAHFHNYRHYVSQCPVSTLDWLPNFPHKAWVDPGKEEGSFTCHWIVVNGNRITACIAIQVHDHYTTTQWAMLIWPVLSHPTTHYKQCHLEQNAYFCSSIVMKICIIKVGERTWNSQYQSNKVTQWKPINTYFPLISRSIIVSS